MVETAKANGLNPRGYIEHLLQGLSQYRTTPTEEQLAAYLPWNQIETTAKQTA
ncbi:transposase domain-containing protein [Lacticaseibacillus pantheris]|nr:transposase domain-containing protein [Lacticaseibacillus pantheris]WKF86153.1 transposase domain-containing protein [Lacticaseibacillus pantheris]